MRIAFAALLSLLLAAPALASSTSTMHVGLVVTGNFAPPLIGTWDSGITARGTIYHFVVGGGSGVFFELVSVPLHETSASDPAAETCDLRVRGVIYSFEPIASREHPHPASSYEMQYAIQSAEVVTSSTDFDGCKEVAASYVSDTPAVDARHSLILSRTGEGHLIDSATGAEYARTP